MTSDQYRELVEFLALKFDDMRSEMRSIAAVTEESLRGEMKAWGEKVDANGSRIEENGRRIEENGRRIDALTLRMDGVETGLGELTGRMDGVETGLGQLTERMDRWAGSA